MKIDAKMPTHVDLLIPAILSCSTSACESCVSSCSLVRSCVIKFSVPQKSLEGEVQCSVPLRVGPTPPLPGHKSRHSHFSTPFPSNPFPSSSFPFPSLRFPCLPLSWPVLACLGSIFPPNLAPTWLPKSTQIQTKWSLGGLPYLDLVFTSIFVRFLLRTWTPQTPKIIEISFVL